MAVRGTEDTGDTGDTGDTANVAKVLRMAGGGGDGWIPITLKVHRANFATHLPFPYSLQPGFGHNVEVHWLVSLNHR